MFKKLDFILQNKRINLIIFITVGLIEFLLIRSMSDLPTELPNWRFKVDDLMHFRMPSDNFYGPGGGILLLPFFWNKPDYLIASCFYLAIGLYFYCKITFLIERTGYKLVAQLLLFLNVYLLWLCVSSQDTVFEFAMYSAFLYLALKEKWGLALLPGVLLASTRSGYWAILIIGIIIVSILEYKKNRLIIRRKLLIIPTLVIISSINFVTYGSPSPALEGGMTAYFSYAKHHYLSLPKFDMDVFLSAENGDFSNQELVDKLKKADTPAEEDRAYFSSAISSALKNPKETLLGWMQKFESHLVSIQKVPQLPGRYVLDNDLKVIRIENERLNWSLIIGNLVYEFYRFVLLFAGLIAAGIYFALKRDILKDIFVNRMNYLFVFWLPSIIPALLFYSETRFKIVQELFLIPLILFIFAKNKSKSSVEN